MKRKKNEIEDDYGNENQDDYETMNQNKENKIIKELK